MSTRIKILLLAGMIMGMFTTIPAEAQSIPQSQGRIIRINYNKVRGKFNTMFKECVGAGRANEGLRADREQQLAVAKKACDFK